MKNTLFQGKRLSCCVYFCKTAFALAIHATKNFFDVAFTMSIHKQGNFSKKRKKILKNIEIRSILYESLFFLTRWEMRIAAESGSSSAQSYLFFTNIELNRRIYEGKPHENLFS